MKTPIEFPTETSALLESPGIAVESAFVNDGARRSMVVVHRVALNGGSPSETPPAVVKFSKPRYALPFSCRIQLATPEYYRKYPGEDIGIRDEKEASYSKKMDLKRFMDRYGPQRSNFGLQTGWGSAELTFGRDDCWMFCTSLKPTTAGKARQLGSRLSEDYDGVTVIGDPSEFARELGVTFGTHLEDTDLRLRGLGILARYTLPPELAATVVWVHHGRVVYTDEPAAIVESYPEERRALIVPFLKRSQYAYQQEYRFVVATHGEAVEKVLRLPISDDLRALTQMGDL